ncbi:MAG: FkbM family methyltransferase [Anaerolineae bacterium]
MMFTSFLHRFDPARRTHIRVPAEFHGSTYGGWTIHPAGLSPDSIVYAFGVGEDISFDLSLIDAYGVQLHAFDPTPRSIARAKTQDLPEQFTLHEVGLADFNGTARFFPPENREHISHTLLDRPPTADRAIEVPVRRLPDLMADLGHDRIDILKMDIEGAEFAVIEDVAAAPVGLVLVEFHHRFEGVTFRETRQAVRRLRRAGYRVFHISEHGTEYSFIHRAAGA